MPGGRLRALVSGRGVTDRGNRRPGEREKDHVWTLIHDTDRVTGGPVDRPRSGTVQDESLPDDALPEVLRLESNFAKAIIRVRSMGLGLLLLVDNGLDQDNEFAIRSLLVDRVFIELANQRLAVQWRDECPMMKSSSSLDIRHFIRVARPSPPLLTTAAVPAAEVSWGSRENPRRPAAVRLL